MLQLHLPFAGFEHRGPLEVPLSPSCDIWSSRHGRKANVTFAITVVSMNEQPHASSGFVEISLSAMTSQRDASALNDFVVVNQRTAGAK